MSCETPEQSPAIEMARKTVHYLEATTGRRAEIVEEKGKVTLFLREAPGQAHPPPRPSGFSIGTECDSAYHANVLAAEWLCAPVQCGACGQPLPSTTT